jgi:uncharacterized membrane protein
VTDDHHPLFGGLINPHKINRQAQLDFLKEKGLYKEHWFSIEVVRLVLSLDRYKLEKVTPEAQDLIKFLTNKKSYAQSIDLCRQEIWVQLNSRPKFELFREVWTGQSPTNLTPKGEIEVNFYLPPKLALRKLPPKPPLYKYLRHHK